MLQAMKSVAFGVERVAGAARPYKSSRSSSSRERGAPRQHATDRLLPATRDTTSYDAPFQASRPPTVLDVVGMQPENKYQYDSIRGHSDEDPAQKTEAKKEEAEKKKDGVMTPTEEKQVAKQLGGAQGKELLKEAQAQKKDDQHPMYGGSAAVGGEHANGQHREPFLHLDEDPVLKAASKAWEEANHAANKSYQHSIREWERYKWRERDAEQDFIDRKRLETADWVAHLGTWQKAAIAAREHQRDMLLRADSEATDAYIRAPTKIGRWLPGTEDGLGWLR